jgi:hypothetical protein
MAVTGFLRKARADQRLLVHSALLSAMVTIAVRVLPFGRMRRLLTRLVSIGPRPRRVANVEARIVQAVRRVSALFGSENCLVEALVAQHLLARHGCETTLCFGVASRGRDGAIDAHAWLERGGAVLIGKRAMTYRPLHVPSSRCGLSPLPR